MTSLQRRLLAGFIAALSALGASAATLSADATLLDIPLVAWLTAALAFATGLYSPGSAKVEASEAEPKQ